MDPEFHDHSTPVGKFLLEFIDLIVCTSPVVLTAKTFQSFHHHSSIPGPVKYGNVSIFRQPCPETPQIMTGFFMRFRAGDGMYLKTTGIKSFRDPLDISAFSGSIPAFIGDDHRHSFAVEPIMQASELRLEFFKLCLVLFVSHFFSIQRDLA